MKSNHAIDMIRKRAIERATMKDARNPIGICSGQWKEHRQTQIKQADPVNGRPAEVVCYANTAAVDLEREVVVPTGLDMKSYMQVNRNLFVDHQYDICSAVAWCRKMVLDSNGWLCYGQFLQGVDSPYAQACLALARVGTLAMSVGFEALDWGSPTAAEAKLYPGIESIVRKARVLEVSYTAMPMNVTCRQVTVGPDASEMADKSRKALIDAKISSRVIETFGIKPKKVIVLR